MSNPSGKQNEPYISQIGVQSALDEMRHASIEQDNPLLFLAVVDEYLINPQLPLSTHSRTFALSDLMTDIIYSEYKQLQKALYNQPLEKAVSKVEMLRIIQTDAQQQSPELMCWCWLYYFYIRVDLNITSIEFCDLVHIDERTLRRIRTRAVKRLTEKLMRLEWAARKEQQRRRLLLVLPNLGKSLLVGRDQELKWVIDCLQDSESSHMQIVGSAGIGKTALVETALKLFIEQGDIQRVVWLNQPPELKFIEHYLVECFTPDNPQISLREYFSLSKTIIVLDALPATFDVDELFNLFELLAPAKVIITNRTFISLPKAPSLVLQELPKEAAAEMARHAIRKNTLHREHPVQLDDYVDMVWNRVGGNPYLIEQAINTSDFVYENRLVFSGVNNWLDNVVQSADDDMLYCWMVLALLPPSNYRSADLLSLLPQQLAVSHISRLTQLHVVEATINEQGKEYRLINAARTYMEAGFDSHSKFQLMLESLIDLIGENIHNPLASHIIERALSIKSVNFPDEKRIALVKLWSAIGVEYGHWAIWHLILSPYITNDPHNCDCRINYAICLRNLGRWDEAQTLLEETVSLSGEAGLFLNQAKALTELSPIYRYRGSYQTALTVVSRAEDVATRLDDYEILSRIYIERCQISIDLQDHIAIEQIISLLPQSIGGRLVACEGYLVLGEIERSRTITHALLQGSDNPAIQARVHTLCGRTFLKEGQLTDAHKQFSLAMSLFEKTQDAFAVGRAASNLGSISISLGEMDEALMLLESAEHTQHVLNDSIGLATTRHNLLFLKSLQ